jgi:hypothetical protein
VRGVTIKERQPGYYWVRTGSSEPHVAEYAQDYMDRWGWLFCGSDDWDADNRDAVEVVSERLLPPDWDKGPPLKSEE